MELVVDVISVVVVGELNAAEEIELGDVRLDAEELDAADNAPLDLWADSLAERLVDRIGAVGRGEEWVRGV